MKGWTRRGEFRWEHEDGSFIVCELHGSEERYFLFNRFRRELSNGKDIERMQGRHEELKRDFPDVFTNVMVSGLKEIPN